MQALSGVGSWKLSTSEWCWVTAIEGHAWCCFEFSAEGFHGRVLALCLC